MSVEREIKARIVGKFKCREFIYLGNTVLIIELKSKEETTYDAVLNGIRP